MSKILVTGPTGNVGKHVVSLAAEMGHDVRALVRDPGKASLPEGVDVAHGDLSSPDTLLAALRDVDSVYLMWPGLAVDARVVELMAEHVRRVVYLSADGTSSRDLSRSLRPESSASSAKPSGATFGGRSSRSRSPASSSPRRGGTPASWKPG